MGIFKKFEFITKPDNAVQSIFRFLSTIIVRSIAWTPITPNHVSILRMIIVIFALYLFFQGDKSSLFLGVILFYIFETLDHVDGDLARYKNQKSYLGPLLEQFIDTWSSRPSNIFGLCFAFGIFNQTESFVGFILFALTVFGRLMWLEYRYYFGWNDEKNSNPETYATPFSNNLQQSILNFFKILYIWNNSFLLIGALMTSFSIKIFGIDAIIFGFICVAIINNLTWPYIVTKGFVTAIRFDNDSK